MYSEIRPKEQNLEIRRTKYPLTGLKKVIIFQLAVAK